MSLVLQTLKIKDFFVDVIVELKEFYATKVSHIKLQSRVVVICVNLIVKTEENSHKTL